MALDPFENARNETAAQEQLRGLDVGVVVDTSPENHMVAVKEVTSTGQPMTETSPTSASVLVSQHGDIALPQKGDLVIVGRMTSDIAVVLGTFYSDKTEIRTASAESRHIGADDGDGTYLHGPFGVVPIRSEAVTGVPNGSVWYRDDIDEYRGMEDDTKVTFETTPV